MDSAAKKRKNVLLPVLLSVISLSTGIAIYAFFRVRSLNIFSWLEMLHIDIGLDFGDFGSGKMIADNASPLLIFCIYSLPDGLWALSAFLILGAVLTENKKFFYIYSAAFLALSVIFELLQFSGFVPGTFDFMDIFAVAAAYLAGVAVYKKNFCEEDSYES